MSQLQVFKRTSLKVELLLFVLMICALRTMREEIPILTLVVPQLLEETGYEKRQTSMIKTTVLQFMFKAP